MNAAASLLLATSLTIAHHANATPLAADNPFAGPSKLVFGYPAFDKIRDEHYAPAYEAGMREQNADIAAIATNKAAPSFTNTIVAMEQSGQLLHRVSAVFGNLSGAHTNAAMEELDRTLAPKLAEHQDAIYLNAALYARVKALYEQREQLELDEESAFLLERYHTDFVRAGARLSAADQDRLKTLNRELAALQTRFGQNVRNEVNASALVVDTREELDGMTPAAIDAAAAAAAAHGLPGKFLLAMINTSGQAPLAELRNRAVRERLMAASLARGSRGGEFDNRDVILRIVALRAERAALLGYASHAAYALEDQTAKTPAAVNELLASFATPAAANARREARDIQQAIDAAQGGFALAAHDWPLYSDKVRATRFAFDAAQLKPYFELDNVLIRGVFHAANKVYGLSFRERHDLPVYHPDVRVFDVLDTDGKLLAIFLADMYARPSKRGGAWMNAYVSQSTLLGTHPVVGNHLNISKPAAGEPTLLSYDEVRTIFHEFGHALHGMFSNVTYPRFSGTRVPRDFVEFPSQVNEMWAVWPEVLENYARHYQTGAAMPRELLDKVIKSQQFNEGFRTTEYLAAAILDQRWHQLDAAQLPQDVLAFETSALKAAGVDFAPVPPRYRSTYFSHVFSGGYSAGYYSYLWSEKLDADAVDWFRESGGMLRKNGDHFRKTVLSRGGTLDAMAMYRAFRGRDARIEPLLERRGLQAQ